MSTPGTDPYLDAVTRLLDLAKHRGFTSTPAGEGGSLWLERDGGQWHDTVFLDASGHCNAVRSRRGHLAPGEPLFAESITGTALTVLHTVIYGWLHPPHNSSAAVGWASPAKTLPAGERNKPWETSPGRRGAEMRPAYPARQR